MLPDEVHAGGLEFLAGIEVFNLPYIFVIELAYDFPRPVPVLAAEIVGDFHQAVCRSGHCREHDEVGLPVEHNLRDILHSLGTPD